MVGIATVTDDNMHEGYYGTVSKTMSQMHIKLCWSHNKPCPDLLVSHLFILHWTEPSSALNLST